MTIAIIGTGNMAKGVNGGRNPGHWGGVKPGQLGSTEAAREARLSIAP